MHAAIVQFLICLAVVPALAIQRDAHASDDHARSAIFAEQHATDAALDLHRTAVALPPDERFELLSRWILPGPEHPTLRLHAAFSPTGLPPAVATSLGESIPKAGQRLPSGGRLVSPVLDLIDTAAELSQLDDLRRQLTAWQPPDTTSERKRTAILALIEIARGDANAALPHLENLLKSRTAGSAQDLAGLRSDTARPSDAELLVLERARDEPALQELSGELIAFFRPWVLSDFDRPVPHRYVSGFVARLLLKQEKSRFAEEPLRRQSQTPLTQWQAASRSTAQTRGAGQPNADWLWQPGFVGNVDSHDTDYLVFNTPLTDNYAVEGDVTGFEWRDTSLLVAGNWVAPVYTHKHFDSGSFRGTRPRTAFDPPLTKVRSLIHYRTVVRDGTATTWFNGRPIHSETLPENASPWVAIRSSARHDGAVQNLRITGSPTVPDALHLSAVESLSDWIPYFEGVESDVNQPLWYVAPRGGADNEITGLGTRAGEVITPAENQPIAGTRESLLRYFRPMAEDGEIEYEFYYVPGQLQAHPALDRLAFLLLPDGVRIHWITDGPFDRTGLASDNDTVEPACRCGPAQLPLKTDDWNRVRLAVNGDMVRLMLNDELIYERHLAATNQRTFGLFHFADWSTLLVRRVVWRGNWPRELPSLAGQELATPEAEFLDDDLDRLAAHFEHDFVRDGLPLDRFTVMRGDPGTQLQRTPAGLLATRDGTGGYQNATVAPALEVGGDFDITAEFSQLDGEVGAEGKIMLALIAILDNATQDEFIVTRRYHGKSEKQIDHVVQCIAVERLPEGARRDYLLTEPMEEKAGRFRLARRGDQLFYLTAENDSPHFQLRSQRKVSTDPIAMDGLRLLAQIFGDGGRVSVVWKRLVIRAEDLQGRALTGVNATVVALNKQRDQLPARLSHDFRTQAATDERFHRWGTISPWQATPDGWPIAHHGTDNWTSSGVSVQSRLEGNFDITFRFDPVTLAVPKPGEHSQVYLQLELSDTDQTSLGAIFTQEPGGETAALAQVRERNADGSARYRVIGQVAVGKASTLRIARRDSTLTFLAAGSIDGTDQIIAEYERSDAPIDRGNIRLMLHTGGADRTSTARWQSIDIRAETIDGQTGVKPPPAAPPPSVLDRVLDFFK